MNETNPEMAGASIVAVLLILGYLIKAYTPINKTYIPLILLAVGTPLQMYGQQSDWSSLWGWINAFVWAAGPTGIHEAAKKSGSVAKTAIFILPLAILFATGCARFGTVQTDMSFNEDGSRLREVTTETRASTLFASKAKLAELETLNTDASQRTEVGQAELITEESLSELVGIITEQVAAYFSGGTTVLAEGVASNLPAGSTVTLSKEDLDKLLNAVRNIKN